MYVYTSVYVYLLILEGTVYMNVDNIMPRINLC